MNMIYAQRIVQLNTIDRYACHRIYLTRILMQSELETRTTETDFFLKPELVQRHYQEISRRINVL